MTRLNHARLSILSGLLIILMLPGCQPAQVTEDANFNRPLPEGAFGLRRITNPLDRPDMQTLLGQLRDPAAQTALERSLRWFAIPSTRQHFPVGPISHPHAWTSVFALTQMTNLGQLHKEFDVWESVGYNGRGDVLYTGYYSPEFRASRTRTGPYQHPLYQRPPNLHTDPVTGKVQGFYPTRAQLEASNQLRGLELVYLPSVLDAYIIQVNGSAKLTMPDGEIMYVGYAATNGHDYTSLAMELINDGQLSETDANLPAIKRYFEQHPHRLDDYVNRNDRFVFFQEYNGEHWPAGSLGFKVTPMRTIATDKAIFPRGAPVWAVTTFPTVSGGERSFQQLMVDQDTGGAIRAAGRADIYVGIGPAAEQLAGRQKAQGKMYYLLLRPERVQGWFDIMNARNRPAPPPFDFNPGS